MQNVQQPQGNYLVSVMLPVIVSFIAVITLFGYTYTRDTSLTAQIQELQQTTENLAKENETHETDIANTRNITVGLSKSLVHSDKIVQTLLSELKHTAGQVDTLDKLSKTDPELLQKYSKIYFLNEHYVPIRLSEIETQYVYNQDTGEQVHTSVLPYLIDLLNAAKRDGMTMFVKSAYRSFDEQENLKSQYRVVYGAGTANQFSAEQGYSEHQLGTTVDFTTIEMNGQLDGFETTQAYEWMRNNAHRYGFTLSYPPNNPSYIFEPWHWRYVGVALATFLHGNNKYFYDVEQREIDEYLVTLFD